MARPMSPTSERRALIALFAVFALLVQALAPAAVAGPRLTPGDTLCVAGRVAARDAAAPGSGGAHKPWAGLHCQDCLVAATAAITPHAPMIARVRYAVAEARHVAQADAPLPRARGPPRPFGQGPPVQTNA